MKKISGTVCRAWYVVDSVNYFKIIGFSLLLSMLGFILPAPDYLQAETVTRKGILFYDDCEDAPNLTSDYIKNGVEPVVVSSEVARVGTKSYKFYLPISYNLGSQYRRNELVPAKVTSPKISHFEHDTEYWVGYSIYIPSNFPLPLSGEYGVLGQYHEEPDSCDWTGSSPTNCFYTSTANGEKFRLYFRAEAEVCSDGNNVIAESFLTPSFVRGGWNDIVQHFIFNWDISKGPMAEAWINGVKVAGTPYTGINCWNNSSGPYWKFGIYASATNPMTVYYDEIRIGGPTSDYASVAPGNSSAPPHAPSGLTVK